MQECVRGTKTGKSYTSFGYHLCWSAERKEWLAIDEEGNTIQSAPSLRPLRDKLRNLKLKGLI